MIATSGDARDLATTIIGPAAESQPVVRGGSELAGRAAFRIAAESTLIEGRSSRQAIAANTTSKKPKE